MDQAKELRRLILEAQQKNTKKIDLNAKVIAITSGKGGVGKSNLSLNLALYLHSLGKKVIIIDADFGCSNIEVLLGVRPQYNFSNLMKGEKNISEIIVETKFGISFISGGSGFTSLSNLTDSQINYFIEQFEYLDNLFDIIIIDTGSGVSRNVTSFAKASDQVIIVTTPEPTSFTDAYAFMKVIADKNESLPPMKLVVNKTEDYFEASNVYNKLYNAGTKFLGIKIENLGHIPLDDNLVRTIKKQEPIFLVYPDSKFSLSIKKIGDKLNLLEKTDLKQSEGIKSFMKKFINIFNK